VTRVHARAARRERQLAATLGTTRIIRRSRYERAPDVVPFRLADGTVVQPESKSRVAIPKWLVEAIAQARRYTPGAVPLVVLASLGGEQLALLPLKDFARIAGVSPLIEGEQLLLGRTPS
jgi:hypothetical protein